MKEIMTIDKFQLDVEAERISASIQNIGEERAVAEGNKDRLYAQYKLLKNEKNLYYRMNPPKDTKVTESVVESLVETDKDVVAARNAFLVAQEEFATMDVAYTAIRDKSSKIRDLITLFGMGYFADSRQAVTKKLRDDSIIDY
jgi:uncharacterized secreted protein with C-terminal beta-propeller domain